MNYDSLDMLKKLNSFLQQIHAKPFVEQMLLNHLYVDKHLIVFCDTK